MNINNFNDRLNENNNYFNNKTEQKNKPKKAPKEEVKVENMVETVAAKKKPLIAKHRTRNAANTPPPIAEKIVKTLIKVAKKEVKSSKPNIAPTRQVAGKRIYHFKSDILPWMNNMFKAGLRSTDYIKQKFGLIIDDTPGLSPEQKQTLKGIAAQEIIKSNVKLNEKRTEILNAFETSQDLKKIILPEKDIVKAFKEVSKSIEKSVHENIRECGAALQEATLKECPDLPFLAKEKIQAFAKEMSENASNLEGYKRFEIIHEDEFWNPEHVTKRYMGLVSSSGEHIRAKSSFVAVGPAFSSQASRNRTVGRACAANFFRTTFSLKPENVKQEKEVLNITRSAITVEFDQKDVEERTKCNQKLLKQVINEHIDQLVSEVSKQSPEKLNTATDPNTPLVLKLQTINLLTPDLLRNIARENEYFRSISSKVTHKLSGAPADDERALALENMAAHKALNGLVKIHQIKDPVSGLDKTIYVQLDLRYFNIPNNSLYSKLPQFLTDSPELTQANNKSWDKLEVDVSEHFYRLENEIKAAVSSPTLSEESKKLLVKLELGSKEYFFQRGYIMQETIKAGHIDKKDSKFLEWQTNIDTWAQELKILANSSEHGDEFKHVIDLIKKKQQIGDLFLDTRELFIGGLSKSLKNMDNNRSALATRVIVLGALVDDLHQHFGCRSGKDRTGLTDIEVKLLLALAEFKGRMPSYREQEKMADTINLREVITMESGNVFDFVRANLGASVGLNTGGAAYKLLEENEAAQQHQEITEASQAFSSIASRPPTKWMIPPGYHDYWRPPREKLS